MQSVLLLLFICTIYGTFGFASRTNPQLNVGASAAGGASIKAPGRYSAVSSSDVVVAEKPVADLGNERTAGIMSSTFSLSKGILGAGMLALPSGVAAFSDKPRALLSASLILFGMGIMSAFSFSSIGRACDVTGSKSFNEAWGKLINKKSAVWLSFLIAFKTLFTCLTYSIVIGDSFSQIIQSFGVNPMIASRTNVILASTGFFIFPLCCQKTLEALKYTSILGMIGTVYCPIFMLWRYLDGTYGPAGKFLASVPIDLQPSFNVRSGPQSSLLIFKLLAMLSTAYVAHYSAPIFLNELRNPTRERYNRFVNNGFGASFLIMLATMIIGFLSFGGNSSGFVLNNYAVNDIFATVARIAVGTGVLCGYPLIFTALREGCFDLVGASKETRNVFNVPFTASILGLVTAVALVVTNLGSVVSFSGALTGAVLIYIVPALMNLSLLRKDIEENNNEVTTQLRVGQLMNYFMLIFGALCSVVGTTIYLVGM